MLITPLTSTIREYKKGMDISYDVHGVCHLVVVLFAGIREPLYNVNRPENVPSHTDSANCIDKGLSPVSNIFEMVYMRGNTDFSLTANFDRWTQCAVFLFLVWTPGQI